MSTREAGVPKVYQIKVTLSGSRPPIWRRFQVTGDVSLYKLHRVLQAVMGWQDYHLHEFNIGGKQYGEPDPDYGREIVNDTRTKLNQVVTAEKTKFGYLYDFGDNWKHELVVEKILSPEPGKRYPICLAGKRRCPPEDVGGIWGYEDFLATIQNPDDPEHEEMLEWAGGSFNPEEFDLDQVNRALSKIR